MRFSIAVLFAASLVSALTVLKRQTDLPTCAQPCIANASPSPCNATDIPCICLNEKWYTAVGTCIQGACSAQDAQTALEAGIAQCKAVGVDPTNPWPTCSQSCVANAKPTGTCTADDDACLCKDSGFIGSIVQCVYGACTGQDLTNAETVGEAFCRAAGVDISSSVGAA